MHSIAITERGVTLVEMLVTIVIVSILAAIAVPSYQDYVRRSERQKGAACLMDISKQVQAFQQRRNVYPTSLTQVGFASATATCRENTRYTVTLTNETTGPACSGSGLDRYQLTAQPTSGSTQVKDGFLRLTQCFDGTAQRYRELGNNQW